MSNCKLLTIIGRHILICAKEQVHTLQRHAQREPITYEDDGLNNERFSEKVSNFTSNVYAGGFTGPLDFLNTYSYEMTSRGYLLGSGAVTEMAAGASFWSKYGRILYNATAGQLGYDSTFANGTTRPKPVLRTTGQARIENSMLNWALGFFGSTIQASPDLTLSNLTDIYETVIIPEGGTENNTLASYDSCTNEYATNEVGYLGDNLVWTYLPKYLQDATARMQEYAPEGFVFTVNVSDFPSQQWPISDSSYRIHTPCKQFALMRLHILLPPTFVDCSLRTNGLGSRIR